MYSHAYSIRPSADLPTFSLTDQTRRPPKTFTAVPPAFRMLFPLALIVLFCLDVAGGAAAQEKYTVSGTIKNAENGEAIIGAYVVVKELKNTGASSNAYGFYSLTIPGGRYTLLTPISPTGLWDTSRRTRWTRR